MNKANREAENCLTSSRALKGFFGSMLSVLRGHRVPVTQTSREYRPAALNMERISQFLSNARQNNSKENQDLDRDVRRTDEVFYTHKASTRAGRVSRKQDPRSTDRKTSQGDTKKGHRSEGNE